LPLPEITSNLLVAVPPLGVVWLCCVESEDGDDDVGVDGVPLGGKIDMSYKQSPILGSTN